MMMPTMIPTIVWALGDSTGSESIFKLQTRSGIAMDRCTCPGEKKKECKGSTEVRLWVLLVLYTSVFVCVLVLLMRCDVLWLLMPLAIVMLFHVSAITDIAICAELCMIRLLSILLLLLMILVHTHQSEQTQQTEQSIAALF